MAYEKGGDPTCIDDQRLLLQLQSYEHAVVEEMSKRQSRRAEDYDDVIEALARRVAQVGRVHALELHQQWERQGDVLSPQHAQRVALLESERPLPPDDQQTQVARIVARVFVKQCLTRHRWR